MAEPTTPSSVGVFISYRRQDTAAYARLLREELGRRLDAGQVFMDVDSIEVGVDFAEAIERAVGACAVLLALVGPRWLSATDAEGQRRLDDPDDTVRLEIEAALGRDVRVIPVLVDDAAMPRRQQLPDSLAPLARRNALGLSYDRYAYDLERLLDAVSRVLGRTISPSPPSAGSGPESPAVTDTHAAGPEIPAVSPAPAADVGAPALLGEQVRSFAHPSKARPGDNTAVSGVAFSPDGRWLATGSRDSTARIWDAHSGQQLHALTHDGSVTSLAFSPDGHLLATGSDDHTARIWDVATGRQRSQATQEDAIWSVAFSPDGNWLATGSRDRTARIWAASRFRSYFTHKGATFDRATGRRIKPVDAGPVRGVLGEERNKVTHKDAVRGVAFSPDGHLLATGSDDHTARIWDAATGRQRSQLLHEDTVRGVAFNPDGHLLATGSDDHTARVWDVASGQERARVTHDDTVVAVAFSPDGQLLATGSLDHTARVWEVPSGRQLRALTHDDDWVEAVAFSHDSRWLATGTYGNRAVLWALTPPSHR